jgi:hypothetical protein
VGGSSDVIPGSHLNKPSEKLGLTQEPSKISVESHGVENRDLSSRFKLLEECLNFSLQIFATFQLWFQKKKRSIRSNLTNSAISKICPAPTMASSGLSLISTLSTCTAWFAFGGFSLKSKSIKNEDCVITLDNLIEHAGFAAKNDIERIRCALKLLWPVLDGDVSFQHVDETILLISFNIKDRILTRLTNGGLSA